MTHDPPRLDSSGGPESTKADAALRQIGMIDRELGALDDRLEALRRAHDKHTVTSDASGREMLTLSSRMLRSDEVQANTTKALRILTDEVSVLRSKGRTRRSLLWIVAIGSALGGATVSATLRFSVRSDVPRPSASP